MSGHVYAAISHKGGAGRSTAAANAAFQAADAGYSVCLVDLDLDSATLGAVLGLSDSVVGGNVGIQSLLAVNRRQDLSPGELLIDLHAARYKDKLTFTGASPGAFRLLPGNARQETLVGDQAMATILGDALSWLANQFNLVIIDVRAGKSEALRALLYGARDLDEFSCLLFYRWTHQHLSAASDMIDTLQVWSDAFEISTPVIPVATARISKAAVADKRWFKHQHDELERREDLEIAGRLGRSARVIPFDPVFQWKEQVLCGPKHAGMPETEAAFRDLGLALAQGTA